MDMCFGMLKGIIILVWTLLLDLLWDLFLWTQLRDNCVEKNVCVDLIRIRWCERSGMWGIGGFRDWDFPKGRWENSLIGWRIFRWPTRECVRVYSRGDWMNLM
jgi:hypothetical protein